MSTLRAGDQIFLTYNDAPAEAIRATVCRVLTDGQEGLGPEVEDYVASWLEISFGDCADISSRRLLSFGTDYKYSMDGREVTIKDVGTLLPTCP